MERHTQRWDLQRSRTRLLASTIHLLLLGSALAASVLSCTSAAPIAESQYATAIVGEWQGTVGDTRESITFQADGGFHALLRERGFISNTLSQGVAGTIRGTWAIEGEIITLTTISSEDAGAANGATSSAIVAMSRDELSLRSESGETSVFLRAVSL